MVCPRCVTAVEGVFKQAHYPPLKIKLGEVTLPENLSAEAQMQIAKALEKLGFELLEDARSKLIAQIKACVVQWVFYREEPVHINFSDYLAEQLKHEYTYLSRLFSTVEGLTIEKYMTTQKMERAKELLFYDQLSLAQIADKLGYNSVAYLSSQFKKETGMTITQFRKERGPHHKHIGGSGA